jgi:prefoldin subunit 5
LRLQNEQKDARITQAQMQSLQQQLQALQAQFQSQLAAVTADAERVKEAHKWDKAVTFDVNSLTFNDPPPAPAKTDKK